MFCFHTPILPYPQKFQQPFVPFCFVLAQSLTGLKTIPFVLSCVFLFTKRPWFQYTNAVLVTPLQQQPFVSTEMGGALQRSSNSKAGQRERPVRYTIPRGHTFRCKIAIKSVQAVFRSLATLEKTVEKCHIELDEQKNRLTFTLHCKHGLMKTHNLSFQDSESLQAVFDKDSYANVFRCNPRLLVDTVVHFPPSLEEVTVSVSDERMWFRNHVEEDADQSKAMLTELCLASEEFDHFAVKAHNGVTFCLKELRGLLVFAESTGLPISMYFDEPGSPVVLSLTDSVLEGNFVLATLSDDPNHRKNNPRRACTPPPPPPPDDFMNDDIDCYLIAMDTSIAPGASGAGPPTPPLSDSLCSKPSAAANHRTRPHSEEEEDETADSGRPPNKKFCSLFFGSVLPASSQMTTQPVTSQQVLASDSEEDVQ